MTRSLKKGPYVDPRLLEKVDKALAVGSHEPIRTWSRRCTIPPEFVGRTFEVHNGKLIAHSLGNFIFDLYYPETMPTIVLTLELTKDGIVGTTFVPAWIDDDIPQPATGRLGQEILDRALRPARRASPAQTPAPGRQKSEHPARASPRSRSAAIA